MKPTIHKNGTSTAVLLHSYTEAAQALSAALDLVSMKLRQVRHELEALMRYCEEHAPFMVRFKIGECVIEAMARNRPMVVTEVLADGYRCDWHTAKDEPRSDIFSLNAIRLASITAPSGVAPAPAPEKPLL
jgi:hypothetical protein